MMTMMILTSLVPVP